MQSSLRGSRPVPALWSALLSALRVHDLRPGTVRDLDRGYRPRAHAKLDGSGPVVRMAKAPLAAAWPTARSTGAGSVFDLEKTVVDCFRFRNRSASTCTRAMREYVPTRRNVERLLHYAAVDRVAKTIGPTCNVVTEAEDSAFRAGATAHLAQERGDDVQVCSRNFVSRRLLAPSPRLTHASDFVLKGACCSPPGPRSRTCRSRPRLSSCDAVDRCVMQQRSTLRRGRRTYSRIASSATSRPIRFGSGSSRRRSSPVDTGTCTPSTCGGPRRGQGALAMRNHPDGRPSSFGVRAGSVSRSSLERCLGREVVLRAGPTAGDHSAWHPARDRGRTALHRLPDPAST